MFNIYQNIGTLNKYFLYQNIGTLYIIYFGYEPNPLSL